MRWGLLLWAALGLVSLLTVSAATPARADDPASQTCEVPDSLLATDSQLNKVADAVKANRPLDIVVIGSRSSTIVSSDTSAYPARLLAALKEKLPQATINLSTEIQARKTAEEIVGSFPKLMEAKKPTLVIWQTGTVDAMRSVDPEDFRNSVTEGVVALQSGGADVVLVNPQYSPRTETMISVPSYTDNIRAVALEHDVPVFDRFAIMHQWSDQGDFDLFSAAHGIDLAKRVHDCLGRALAKFIIDAAHLGPAQQN